MQGETQQVTEAIGMSGLLFQNHPEIGNWKTTRPGAMTGEVVAFTNKAVDPVFDRLSLRYFGEGEEDEDGYTYHQDSWIVETLDRGDYVWEGEVYHSRENAIERLVEIMIDIVEERETA